ncbi:hypothetical protein ACQ856_30105 (plasmid) [Mycolicibacterium psychrotolerans]|uniref:hypothetical protein n=1 Tax=Mycolicibacterium psychrotolerans TaxID=216929 RepID=UPI003D6776CF
MTLAPNAARYDGERQLVQAAIGRLRDNTAERSNGARTVVALAAESGVPRQRLYEHHSDLLDEFKATIGHGPVDPNIEALQRQLAKCRDRNQELTVENAHFQAKIRTLSAVIAELTHDRSRRDAVVSMRRKHLGSNR